MILRVFFVCDSNIPNKFLVRFFVSYCLHNCRLVSVIHSINAAFGVSKAFVPYRPSWDLVQSAITPSTFTITPETGVTIAAATTWKCNGLAFFALSFSRATAIPANTSIGIGTIEASSMKIGDSPVVFAARGDSDTILMSTIISGYISAGNQQYIKIRALAEIPANAVVYITGTFRCK